MRLYNKEEISENKGENDMKKRGFEVAKGFEDAGINLPVRKTKYSAGYDVEAAEDTIIPAFKRGQKPTLVKTGIKAFMEDDANGMTPYITDVQYGYNIPINLYSSDTTDSIVQVNPTNLMEDMMGVSYSSSVNFEGF